MYNTVAPEQMTMKLGRERQCAIKRREEPAEVDVSEATRADDIFTKFRSAILNAIFTTINSKGRNGAPPQSIKTVASGHQTHITFLFC